MTIDLMFCNQVNVKNATPVKADPYDATRTWTAPIAMHQGMDKYLGAFCCPSDKYGPVNANGQVKRSYSLNLGLEGAGNYLDVASSIRIAIPTAFVVEPAGTVHLMETWRDVPNCFGRHGYSGHRGASFITVGDGAGGIGSDWNLNWSMTGYNGSAALGHLLHGTKLVPKADCLMFDGHTEFFTERELRGGPGVGPLTLLRYTK